MVQLQIVAKAGLFECCVKQIEKIIFAYMFGQGVVCLFDDFIDNLNYAVLYFIVPADDGGAVVDFYRITFGACLECYSQIAVVEVPAWQ